MQIISGKDYKQELNNFSLTNLSNQELDNIVLDIIQTVRQKGDDALFDYTKQFDHIELDSLLVTEEEFIEAEKQVSQQFINSIKEAKKNIEDYHAEQKENSWFLEKENGILLGQKITPLDRVGIYVPGGKAAYPSTVLMNAIPAKIANVPFIAMTTPAQKDGKVNPHVLVAAQIAGVSNVYKLGGAQAIAAFAYGTETVPRVDKIVGPGNAFVARAKKWVYGDVAIDMIAGPSEICIICDETAKVSYIASDLLSQAEHDEQARAICITLNKEIANQIKNEVQKQLKQLDRNEIATTSIKNEGRIVVCENEKELYELVNLLAPEHLQIMMENPFEKMKNVKHAGAIFLGNYSPEVLGDYFAGPNHTLPTSGTARFASPLGVYDFFKKSSIIQYSKEALLKAADSIETIAEMEGLTAHKKAITIRKDDQ